MDSPGTFGTVTYFDGRAEALVTDDGVIANADGEWVPCNETWAAAFERDDFATWEREMG